MDSQHEYHNLIVIVMFSYSFLLLVLNRGVFVKFYIVFLHNCDCGVLSF